MSPDLTTESVEEYCSMIHSWNFCWNQTWFVDSVHHNPHIMNENAFVLTERVTFNETDLCITTGMSINGRLFITPQEHLDALVTILF